MVAMYLTVWSEELWWKNIFLKLQNNAKTKWRWVGWLSEIKQEITFT